MAGSRTALYHSKTTLGLVFIVLSISILMLSCTRKPGTEAASDRKEGGIHKTVEKDEASVTIDIDKKEMTTADRLHLTISAACPEDWAISLPAVDNKFGEFVTVGYDTKRPLLTEENKKIAKRVFILEPFLSGEYRIPPIHVEFTTDEKTIEIDTPEISVKVTSLLPPSVNEPKQGLEINDINPPLSLPLAFPIWMWGLILIAAMVMAASAVYFFRKKSLKNGAEMRADPADAALKALEQLAAEKLEEKGESKTLYHGVSSILRRYIEQSFGIRAPEQTTEEFLAGLEKGSGFPDDYNRLLKDFLRHCDLVKFAEHRPRTGDIHNTFSSCKEFIEGTRERRTDAL